MGYASSDADWATFSYTLSPGMQLVWGFQSSDVSARVDVDSVIGVDYESNSVSDWTSDVFADATYPGIGHYSKIENGILISYSKVNNSAMENLHTQDTAQRTGYFNVIGDGTVTFSLNYMLGSAMSNSGVDQCYAGARFGLSLNNLTLGTVTASAGNQRTVTTTTPNVGTAYIPATVTPWKSALDIMTSVVKSSGGGVLPSFPVSSW